VTGSPEYTELMPANCHPPNDQIERTRGVAHPPLASTDRQRPHEARRVVVRLVVVREPEVGVEVPEILRRRRVAILILERARSVVFRLRQRGGTQHRDAASQPPFVFHHQRLVARLAAVERVGDVGPILNRAALLQRQRTRRIVRNRLVVVREEQHVFGTIADVRDVDDHIGANLALH